MSVKGITVRFPIQASAVATAVVLFCSQALAGMPMPQTVTCPIGGKDFTFITTASYSIYGSRPDGKPYGSWRFPLALPICPDNGLVIYRPFEPAEVSKLQALMRSADYLALSQDTPRYRAAWIEQQLKPDSNRRLVLLLEASWEADRDPNMKRRYQQAFVDAVAQRRPDPDSLDWVALQVRAANAERELGAFDASLSRLRAIPTANLDVPVPAERSHPNDKGFGTVVENSAERREALNRRSWLDRIRSIETLSARRDPSSEPLDMLEPRYAAELCAAMSEADLAARDPTGVCKSDDVTMFTDMWPKHARP